MSVCRTCLDSKTDKDILEIKSKKKFGNKTFVDMMLFCLDIMVDKNIPVTTRLCIKCYRKILAFHKFKTQAITNEIQLQNQYKSEKLNNNENDSTMDLEDNIEMEDSNSDDNKDIFFNIGDEIKIEPPQDVENDMIEKDIKEIEIKPPVDSDDELLIVYKDIKNESLVDTEKIKKEDDSKNVSKFKKGKRKKKISTANTNEKKICEECGAKVKDIRGHMKKHLPAEKRTRVPCRLCDKTFATCNSRYKHVKRKHLNIKHTCKICNKSVAALSTHMLLKHNPSKLQHECPVCERRFISKSRLNDHMTIHTKDRAYKCSTCEKRFRTKICMVTHERQVHNKEKTHMCQFCSKTFFKKYHLQLHIRSHTKEKPYECKKCGKRFSTTTILRNHELIHNDVKDFACEICNMSFVRRGYLKAHMITHTKEKRYPCKFCDAKFHRSDHRKRHEYTAHQRAMENTLDNSIV